MFKRQRCQQELKFGRGQFTAVRIALLNLICANGAPGHRTKLSIGPAGKMTQRN